MEATGTNDEKTPTPTPSSRTTGEQARQALDTAAAANIDHSQDRSVHALATAGFGLLIGAYFALTRTELFSTGVASAGYVLIAMALAAWQSKTAKSSPRGTRSVGRWALGLTIVAIILALGVVNSAYRDGDVPLWAVAASGVAVAAPLLVAAGLIHRGPR